MGGLSPWQDPEPATSTDITPSQFDQLAAAFCTSECLLDFQLDDDYEIATFPSCSQVPVPNDAKDAIINQHHKYCGKIQKYLSTIDSGGSTSLSLERVQVLGDNATLIGGQLQPPSDRQNDPELESSTRHLGDGYSTCSGSGSSGPIFSSKKRIRWTQGLHEKFVKCVNSLGGAAKAKPNAILKMMETKGLTITQVKSHLQKYRSDKYLSECKQEKPTINDMPQLVFSSRCSMEIKEAQQLQLDIEKHLQEHVEIQRNLLLQIEENGRRLELMLEQQQKTNKSLP
ncbi:FACTOR putative-RELATED [Salix koriyanagi]|uniref:FACTOR putative-RELATED n=1 Tax=Salix koriyanagi TaxID=2511006 RepID=A0A9Q1AP88_9ROSI|nr:FACTOR putative-RELATED [Salix koriyanagi]